MKIYYYREGRTDLDISDNDEVGMFSEFIEVDDEIGKRWLKTYDDWCESFAEITQKI